MRRTLKSAFTLSLWVLLTLSAAKAWSQDLPSASGSPGGSEQAVSDPRSQHFSVASAAVKALGGLVFMVVFIFAIAYVIKRTGYVSAMGQRKLKVRESLNLGAKERLVVVDFAGEVLVLGVTSHSINILKSVSHSQADAFDEPQGKLGATSAADFQTKLQEFLIKGHK